MTNSNVWKSMTLFTFSVFDRKPMGVLHSFSIKNYFYDKMNLGLIYFDVAI